MPGSNSLIVNSKPGFNAHNDSAIADSVMRVHAYHLIELSVQFLRVMVESMHNI